MESHSLINLNRMPADVRAKIQSAYEVAPANGRYLHEDTVYSGDARRLLKLIKPHSIALSVWSPPYYVGKAYESYLSSYEDWRCLIQRVIRLHFDILQPGGFLAINIADILCFQDEQMPRIQADLVSRKGSPIKHEDVAQAMSEHPNLNRYQIAKLLGCSEQTIDRRLNGNNIRGGKHQSQTRVKIVGGMVEDWAIEAGLYPYDRRVWVKDPAWENSRWASLSYRSVDEFEYLYIFWKPGVTRYDRRRLSSEEWVEWGSRGVWTFPSVRSNGEHDSMYPVELPYRTIRLLTDPGDTVLDPFIGSGTTAIAAIRCGRKFIGIDREKKSVEISKRKIASEPRQLCYTIPTTSHKI